jgi:hypothetical protein
LSIRTSPFYSSNAKIQSQAPPQKTGMIEEGLHFLAKPFLSAELASKVRKVLAA